ncbi:MAG TPA: DUF899 domain-containing protein [Streptosporangiaceae bacterium]|jgi:predicted dithiol-disulfide oxidoreductase (DUF899 family)
MALPEVVSREQWLKARRQLLAEEKELTRRRDALNADRRRLPMVRVDKEYVFDGPDGKVTLAGLFGDRRQLFVHHIMFGPDWDAACPSCTQYTSEFTESLITRLASRDTAFAMVCRAPLAKIQAYTAGRGWALPWYSSFGSDFNYDFGVTLDKAAGLVDYNYRAEAGLAGGGEPAELPGASCFLRDGAEIFHTYSAYARGLDHVDFAYAFLDLTAFGRQEEWEEPRDRAPAIQGTL